MNVCVWLCIFHELKRVITVTFEYTIV